MHQTSLIVRLQNSAKFSIQSTQGPVDYYVRDLDGNDDNDGLSPTKAFKTFAPLDRIPFVINHLIVVHVGDHQGTGYKMPILSSHLYNNRLHICGDGAGTGDGFTETLTAEASAAGTDKSKVVSSTGGHSVNEFEGHVVIFTSGDCTGYRRSVHSNTATDLLFTVDTDQLGLSPAPGDTFRVVRPSVLINMSEGFDSAVDYSIASGASIGFSTKSSNPSASGGLIFSQLDINATQSQSFSVSNLHVAFYGVESGRTGGSRVDWIFDNCVCYHGNNDSNGIGASLGVDVGAPDDAAWTGYSVFRTDTGSRGNGGPFVVGSRMSEWWSFIVSKKALEMRGNATIFGGSLVGLDIREVTGRVFIRIFGTSFTTNPTKIFATGTGRALHVFGATVHLFLVDLESDDGNMIDVKRGAFVLDNGSCTGQATGSGDSVVASEGGVYHVTGAPVIGDGSATDYSVDGVASVNKSTFSAAATGISNTLTGSSISRDT